MSDVAMLRLEYNSLKHMLYSQNKYIDIHVYKNATIFAEIGKNEPYLILVNFINGTCNDAKCNT